MPLERPCIILWSWGNPADRLLRLCGTWEETLNTNTPWKRDKNVDVSNTQTTIAPAPTLITQLQGQSSHVFFIKDRLIFFSGVCELHKEAEAEAFTTHLPIKPGAEDKQLVGSLYWHLCTHLHSVQQQRSSAKLGCRHTEEAAWFLYPILWINHKYPAVFKLKPLNLVGFWKVVIMLSSRQWNCRLFKIAIMTVNDACAYISVHTLFSAWPATFG